MIFSVVHSTQFSPEQLYGARTWLERVGKTAEHNALMAFLDSKTWVGKVGARPLTPQGKVERWSLTKQM